MFLLDKENPVLQIYSLQEPEQHESSPTAQLQSTQNNILGDFLESRKWARSPALPAALKHLITHLWSKAPQSWRLIWLTAELELKSTAA